MKPASILRMVRDLIRRSPRRFATYLAVAVAVLGAYQSGGVEEAVRRVTGGGAEASGGHTAPAAPKRADAGDAAGAGADFDYYLLALSWSPSFCRRNPDADQCGKGKRFILHGLWPQYDRGYPQDCPTDRSRVPGRLLREYRDLTGGSGGLLAHQWRKHGTCTGLDQRAYFEASRRAFEAVRTPPSFAALDADAEVSPKAAEEAFVAANPGHVADSVTVICRSGRLAELRICLGRDLRPRRCGADTVRDCRQRRIDLPAPR